MMDAIFASPEEDNRGRLLKLMQEFLVSESTKHSVQEKGRRITLLRSSREIDLIDHEASTKSKATSIKNHEVNMEELVGNTHGFAESGCAHFPDQCVRMCALTASFCLKRKLSCGATLP